MAGLTNGSSSSSDVTIIGESPDSPSSTTSSRAYLHSISNGTRISHSDGNSRPTAAAGKPPTAPAQPLLLTYSPWTPIATGTSLARQASSTVSGTVSNSISSRVTASSEASDVDFSSQDSGKSADRLESLCHLPVHPRASRTSAYRSSSQQPGVCWLPGGLMVKPGEVYPLVASHNTVR
jgi:hypothetical protein